MTGEASYDPRRGEGGLDGELARLDAQAALSWPQELRMIRALGVPDRPRILEAGCGPGVVTRRLREAFPGGAITALDRDAELLARVRGLGLPGVTCVEADVAGTGLPDVSVDLVLSRYTYQHLSDPAAAAREALRVLAPGGLHVIVDIDDALWGLADPPAPSNTRIFAQHAAAQAARGGDRTIGRRLWRLLAGCGYACLQLDLFAYHSDDLGRNPFLPQIAPERMLAQIESSAIDPVDLATLYAAYHRFARDPEAFILMVGFLVSGRRR
jgi:SAM-dependent methyltransferase